MPLLLPEPDAHAFLFSWTADVGVVAVLVLLAVGYLVLLVRARRRASLQRDWSPIQGVAFAAGLLTVAWAGCGWPAVYGQLMFSAGAVQLALLLMVGPVLLAAGGPLRLLRASAAAPQAADGGALDAPAPHRGSTPAMTVSLVAPLLVVVVMLTYYLTGWYSAALRGGVVGALTPVVLIGAGLLAAWPLLVADAVDLGFPFAFAVLFGFFELLADAIPGLIVRLYGTLLAADHFGAFTLPWGNGALDDQQRGGAILWIVAETADLPFLLVLATSWVRADRREAALVDRELDDRAHQIAVPQAIDDLGAELTVPWWESDPPR